MKQILCFGDSNTYGLIPGTKDRYDWDTRWSGRIGQRLWEDGCRIVEEGLCGRTTIFEDPLRDNRNGSHMLPALLETHQHADLIIVMLGTNDCKTVFGASADVIGKGISRLLDQIQEYAPKAEVLLISPIYLGKKVWQEEYDQEFSRESVTVSRNLQPVYEKIARDRQIEFLPAADHVKCCEADQEHLNAEGHKKFAEVVYRKLQKLL